MPAAIRLPQPGATLLLPPLPDTHPAAPNELQAPALLALCILLLLAADAGGAARPAASLTEAPEQALPMLGALAPSTTTKPWAIASWVLLTVKSLTSHVTPSVLGPAHTLSSCSEMKSYMTFCRAGEQQERAKRQAVCKGTGASRAPGRSVWALGAA
jgi:hypothetical protein